jgi:hypothetical protein
MEAMGIQIRLSSESFPEQIDDEYGEFNYPELYNYIEKDKEEKKKPSRKTKKKAESETESEESEPDEAAQESDEEIVSESEEGAESELDGGSKEDKVNEDNKQNKDNTKEDLLNLELDTDGIYDDSMNGGEIPTIISDSQLSFNNILEDSDNSSLKLLQEQAKNRKDNEKNLEDDRLINKNKELQHAADVLDNMNQLGKSPESDEFSSVPISMTTAKMPGGTNKSDIKVITLNTGNRLPEPKNKEGGENLDNDDEDAEFFAD